MPKNAATPAIDAEQIGWPRSTRPLVVALLGWARLSSQAREGSGYNLNASDLATGLALSGHKVVYLRSGMTYSLVPGMKVKPEESWRGIECSTVVNSPCLAPAAVNFRNMQAERSSPALSSLVVRWLDSVGAQVVHIHSLEGFSLDLIGEVRATNRPVVVTAHNYWYGCPQVDLLAKEREVCDNYEGGNRCVGCLEAPEPAGRIVKRRLGGTFDRALGEQGSALARSCVDAGKKWLNAIRSDSPGTQAEPVDPELALGFAGVHERSHRPDTQGPVWQVMPKEDKPPLGRAPLDMNERFLAPDAPGSSDRHLVVLNTTYGQRRHDGIAALNRASLVTPPSRFVGDAFIRMGMNADRLRVVRLGQPHFDRLTRRARRSPYYDTPPWNPRTARRPLRFAFLGTTRNNKGLDVLVRAIPLLPREVRERCQFLIRASGWDWVFRKRLSGYPEVQFAGGYDAMQLAGAMGEFDVGLLTHVWFENSPLVMLEHLHAGKFVVASRLGGPVEWILPGVNGMLFPAGDSEALAACIERLVHGEVTIPSAKEVHERTPNLTSYPAHVAEVEGIYRELLGERVERESVATPRAATHQNGDAHTQTPSSLEAKPEGAGLPTRM